MDTETLRRRLAARLAPPAPSDIKAARKLLDLTQRNLADMLGVSRGSVSDWERGRSSPGPENLRRLTALLLGQTVI